MGDPAIIEAITRAIQGGRAVFVVGPQLADDDATALARVPVAQMWTVAAEPTLATALESASPDGWPAPFVAAPDAVIEAGGRARSVVQIFGRGDDHVADKAAVRALIHREPALRERLAEVYTGGTLIFLGFDTEDGALEVLLSRVLIGFAPPSSTHYWLCRGVAEARADEVRGDHAIEVIDPGEDAKAMAALLDEIAGACGEAGVDLSRPRPAADDLDGWLALWIEDPADPAVIGAVAAMEASAREAGDADQLVEILVARAEMCEEATARADLLAEVAGLYETELSDAARAVAAMTAALRDDPGRGDRLDAAEKLAASAGDFSELVGDVAAIAGDIEDEAVAARYYERLGTWYRERLGHLEYSVVAFHEALRRAPDAIASHEGLAESLRRQQRWPELADALAAHAEVETDPVRGVDVLLALGDLCENQIAQTSRAIEAYDRAASLCPDNEDALAALERLCRRDERWDRLAGVLARRAENLAASGELARAGRIHAELGAVRADKLGDANGAIAAYRAAIDADPRVEETHRALIRLLRSAKDPEALAQALEAYASGVSDAAARGEILASEAEVLEQRGDIEGAITAHERALAELPDHVDSLRALARLAAAAGRWEQAVEAHVRRAEIDGDAAAEAWCEAGIIAADKLADPAAAERRLEAALEADPDYFPALVKLAEILASDRRYAGAAKHFGHAAAVAPGRSDRIHCLRKAARLFAEHLADEEAALSAHLAIVELAPDDTEAGALAADALIARKRFREALPMVDMLARTAMAAGDRDRSKRCFVAGHVAEQLGLGDRAAKHYRDAADADATHIEAHLADVRLAYDAAARTEDKDQLADVDRRCRAVLARFAGKLDDSAAADVWFRIAGCQLAFGDRAKAKDALLRAIERRPGHADALAALVEVAGNSGDGALLARALRAQLDAATGDDRAPLAERLGDVFKDQVGDLAHAAAAYAEGLAVAPQSHVLLHKLLDVATEAKDWRRAIEVLGQLADIERESAVRAKYAYAAAVIARDELEDAELSLAQLDRCLEADHTHPKAFAAIDAILSERGDFRGLARHLRHMLKRLGEGAPAATLLPLWSRLGEICLDHLDDPESAMAAFEVASSLDPDDTDLRERLVNLYLEAGDGHRRDAIEEIQVLIEHAPDRVELFRALSNLYMDEHELDRAFCAARTLVFLGAASNIDNALVQRYRPEALALAPRRITDDLWYEAIVHGREDRHVGAIFASVAGPVAASSARPIEAHGVSARARADIDREGSSLTRLVKHIAHVLALDPRPQVYLAPGSDDPVRVANTVDDGGQLSPSLVVGEHHARDRGERELAFEIGKRMALLRPERFLACALETPLEIEAALAAALSASGVRPAIAADAARLGEALAKQVPAAVLAQVAAIARSLGPRLENGLLSGWRTAVDLTANRVGFILCDDLDVAARFVANEPAGFSALPIKERLRDLLAYSVSDGYFSIRRHLGMTVKDDRPLV